MVYGGVRVGGRGHDGHVHKRGADAGTLTSWAHEQEGSTIQSCHYRLKEREEYRLGYGHLTLNGSQRTLGWLSQMKSAMLSGREVVSETSIQY